MSPSGPQKFLESPRQILLGLRLNGPDPTWSSRLMEQIIDDAARRPGGVAELVFALFDLFGEFQTELSDYVGNFIRDLVVGCFRIQYRASYEAADWKQFARQVSPNLTPAQAYLATLAIPPQVLSESQAVLILRRLIGTSFWTEAAGTLGEHLKNQNGRRLLREWMSEPLSRANDPRVTVAFARAMGLSVEKFSTWLQQAGSGPGARGGTDESKSP